MTGTGNGTTKTLSPQQQALSATIQEIERQRSEALTRAANLAGEIVMLRAQLSQAQDRIKSLEDVEGMAKDQQPEAFKAPLL